MSLATFTRRPDARFLALFGLILVASFFVLALRPVDAAVVQPYTALVTRASGAVLGALGEEITVRGSKLVSPRFSVVIHNGCNGLVTSLIFAAGVLAFPARTAAKLIGLGVGLLGLQLVNLVRIVALFFTGVFLPDLFGQAHIFVWQSIVILSGVALWLLWARRCGAQSASLATSRREAPESPASAEGS